MTLRRDTETHWKVIYVTRDALIVVGAILLLVLFTVVLWVGLQTPADGDTALVNKDEALVEIARLHNAGLLRDVTLAGEPGMGDLSSSPGCRFRLEDVDGSVSDGFVTFVRVGGQLRAVLLESPMSALERLGLACQGQAEIAVLLRPINAAKVARSFTGVLIPEIPVEGWGAKLTIAAAGLGRASVLLRHREGEIETSAEFGLVAVKRDGSWKLEVYSFRMERKQIQPRLE